MRIFKNIAFDKWARKEGLSDAALKTAVDDLNAGRFEANLGGNVYKKRVASQGRGKSGGFRTLIACRVDNMAFLCMGLQKISGLTFPERKS